jgi:hypothetical protein
MSLTNEDQTRRALRLWSLCRDYIDKVARPQFGNEYIPDWRLARFWTQAGYVAPVGVGATGPGHWLQSIGAGNGRVWKVDKAAFEWLDRMLADGWHV